MIIVKAETVAYTPEIAWVLEAFYHMGAKPVDLERELKKLTEDQMYLDGWLKTTSWYKTKKNATQLKTGG